MKNKNFPLMLMFVALTAGCEIKDENNLSYGTVKDIDGYVYKTIVIGTQTWMAENLKTTRYSNGDPIENVKDDEAWDTLITGAYCTYNDDAYGLKDTYGALYNWFAVNDSRNIAPIGWHVPTDAEWTTLTTYLGGENVAGGKLKERGTYNWNSPNVGADNSSGFSALPGGGLFGDDETAQIAGGYGNWWSSSEIDVNDAWYISLTFNYSNVKRQTHYKSCGFSVRCIKD
jgi:uncharacterized protein (TIGR02145 family)